MENFEKEILDVYKRFKRCEKTISYLPRVISKDDRDSIQEKFREFKSCLFNDVKISDSDLIAYEKIDKILCKINDSESKEVPGYCYFNIMNSEFIVNKSEMLNFLQNRKEYRKYISIKRKLENFMKLKLSKENIDKTLRILYNYEDVILRFSQCGHVLNRTTAKPNSLFTMLFEWF